MSDAPRELMSALVGRRYGPDRYAVGREKIREFAVATAETDPLHLDLDAARAGGHPDLVAPPMFAVVFQGRAMGAALFDPELAIDFAHLLHTAQEFRWGRLVHAGDELLTTVALASARTSAGVSTYVFEAESIDADGATVVSGVWTNTVRPEPS